MRILLIGSGGELDAAVAAEAARRGHETLRDGKLAAVEGRHRALSAAGQGSHWLHTEPAGSGMPSGWDAVALLLPISSQSTTHAWSEAVDRLTERLADSPGTRVLALSSPRVAEPRESWLRAWWEAYIVEKVLRNPLLDLARMEAGLRGSGLAWTVVRAMPVRPGKDSVRVARDARLDRPRGVSAAALAHCLLDVLEDPATVGSVVEVG